LGGADSRFRVKKRKENRTTDAGSAFPLNETTLKKNSKNSERLAGIEPPCKVKIDSFTAPHELEASGGCSNYERKGRTPRSNEDSQRGKGVLSTKLTWSCQAL